LLFIELFVKDISVSKFLQFYGLNRCTLNKIIYSPLLCVIAVFIVGYLSKIYNVSFLRVDLI